MRVAVAQVRRFGTVAEAVRWLLATAQPADLLVLPEYWLGTRALSEADLRAVVEELSKVASAIGGYVVGGGIAVDFGGVVKNVCPVVGPGGLEALGEKIFPSNATGERIRVSGGSRLALFELGGWTVGCLICVDLLYPELARRLALEGADLIVNPASVTADRVELWRAVGLARAFENSLYVAAALGTGYRYADGRPAEGGSFIATPNGALVEYGRGEGIYAMELDKREIEHARSRRRYLEDAKAMPTVLVERRHLPRVSLI
ncbi:MULTISPECIES: carbon-nitrogen hydrolase family protein [Pyrobaculum]|uniref:Nitrilase/cyanide hydratase and apolipoprotein N-acyltransferase n=2 Tax=Pyrobaculum arsenaticum TaxID=121277 RepID=A4WKC5_PYRAR|nr:carbon-nitrogen hydrolase family protein [Pyrobaculum arsenaticum]ABP50842.1 Nitrilase/cyanide hydratase and apolipoprotein N-acyltransferase [Pyrobaculum arsenaticum DSM 13514]MCY0891373.1 carbon-nitrogen hydrolase family protein [Pyrobaculum arsenaticum]NYR15438.1 carbon-nitrogen hydrolase family protein [Pyrobaculum arsenaticum]